MAQSFEYMLDKLNGGKAKLEDIPVPDEVSSKIENVQHRENAFKDKPEKKSIMDTANEVYGAIRKTNWMVQSIVAIGLGSIAYHYAVKPAYHAVTSAVADPAHYSANPLSSNFWNDKGDANAPLSNEYVKEWIDNKVKPLHGVVKENLAPDLEAALADNKLTLTETANLSNKISDLNHKFFGTEFPQADAKPIIPQRPKM